MQLIHKDALGKTRPGEMVRCKVCSKHFLVRKDQAKKRKYCSRGCVAYASFNRVELKCAFCDRLFYKTKSKVSDSKSGLHFCSRSCKDSAQKIGGIKEIMPSHYGTGQEAYREKFAGCQFKCQRCGYEEFECSVHIHHIDGNRNNNSLNNLMMLCGNCHFALHHGCWKLNILMAT